MSEQIVNTKGLGLKIEAPLTCTVNLGLSRTERELKRDFNFLFYFIYFFPLKIETGLACTRNLVISRSERELKRDLSFSFN